MFCLAQEEPVTANLHGCTVRIGPPVTFRNLTAFPIETTWKIDAPENYLTLEGAMAEKLLTVVEAAKGYTVYVANTARTPVYLMAGDVIVKGRAPRVFAGLFSNGEPDRRIIHDTIVRPGAEKLPVSVYRKSHENLYDLNPAAKAENQQRQDQVAHYTDEICGGLRENPRCVGAVFALNGELVAADIWSNRALWEQQMAKMAQAYALDAVGSYERWAAEPPEKAATAQDAAALLGQYDLSEREVVSTADGVTNATVKTRNLLGFDTLAGAAFMHIVIFERRSDFSMKPGLSPPSKRMTVLLFPLHVLPADAPPKIGTRIIQELQIACARYNSITVTELLPRSPLMRRALEQRKDDELAQNNLNEDYRLVADAGTDENTRREAAARLINALGVDAAVVYGAVDKYQFTTKPDRNQTYIHLSVATVRLDEGGRTIYSPVDFEGRGNIRPDGGGSKEVHDLEAIQDSAKEWAKIVSYPW
jgi:hypothetical protein